MAVLLLAEITDGQLAMDATAKTVTASKPLGDITVLCVGATCAAAAEEAATIEGVSKVLCAEHDLYGHRLAEPAADLVVSLAGDYSHIVAPATTDAKNLMPRIAALLDVMVISDITAVIDADTFERPIYAGNALQTVKSADATKVISVRGSVFDAAATGGSASVENIGAAGDPGLSAWVEDKVAESDRPELTSAGVVVSGGRGRRWRIPCSCRQWLCPERLAGGPDWQGCGTGSVYRNRDFRRDPALGWDEGFQSHRCNQQR